MSDHAAAAVSAASGAPLSRRAPRARGAAPGGASGSNRLGYVSLVVFAVLFGSASSPKSVQRQAAGRALRRTLVLSPGANATGDDLRRRLPDADRLPGPLHPREPLQGRQLGALFPPNPYHYSTINYFAKEPNPAPPSAENFLGTDDRGRDLLARLLYGFRVSVAVRDCS